MNEIKEEDVVSKIYLHVTSDIALSKLVAAANCAVSDNFKEKQRSLNAKALISMEEYGDISSVSETLAREYVDIYTKVNMYVLSDLDFNRICMCMHVESVCKINVFVGCVLCIC